MMKSWGACNSNLYISLLEHFDIDFIRSQLHDSTTLDLFSEGLIGPIASKLYGLAWPQLDAIPMSVLFHILSHRLLMISSEDALFSYINSHICSDPEYLDFLQFVRFEYLSSESISSFLSALPDSIDCRLWASISRRLISRLHSDNEGDFPRKDALALSEWHETGIRIRGRNNPYRFGNQGTRGIVSRFK
jgi:hypothetical protein